MYSVIGASLDDLLASVLADDTVRLDYPLKDYAKEMKCLPSARHAALVRGALF